jgi:hypothetical protein
MSAFAGRELAAVQLGPKVEGLGVGDDSPLVAGGGEQAAGPRVDAESLGPTELDAAADRRA